MENELGSFDQQLPHDEIMSPNNRYRYDLVPMFRNETIAGRPYVVLTAYFVRPGILSNYFFKVTLNPLQTTTYSQT